MCGFFSLYTRLLPSWISFSQVWPLWSFSVGQCHGSGSSWLSCLPGTTVPHGDCVLTVACVLTFSRGPARPSQWDGEGKRRSGKGTDSRGSGTLGGGKFNKQGNRCLSSFSCFLEQLFTLHGEVCRTLRGPLLVGGFAVIDTFILFRDSFNKQRAASWS